MLKCLLYIYIIAIYILLYFFWIFYNDGFFKEFLLDILQWLILRRRSAKKIIWYMDTLILYAIRTWLITSSDYWSFFFNNSCDTRITSWAGTGGLHPELEQADYILSWNTRITSWVGTRGLHPELKQAVYNLTATRWLHPELQQAVYSLAAKCCLQSGYSTLFTAYLQQLSHCGHNELQHRRQSAAALPIQPNSPDLVKA